MHRTLIVTSLVLALPLAAWSQETPPTTRAVPAPAVEVANSVEETGAALKSRALTEGLTKEIVEKLSPEQLTSVLKTMHRTDPDALSEATMARLEPAQLAAVLMERERQKGRPDMKEVLVPILVPLIFFVFLGSVIAAGLVIGHRQHKEKQETLRLMVEKGATIPPELLSPPAPKKSDLRRGVVLLGAGIGLLVFFALMGDSEPGLWGIGLIPTLIGLGFLLVWKLEPNGHKAQS